MIRFVLLALFITTGCNKPSKYAVGQVWHYKTRPGEDSSLIYIGKIDTDQRQSSIYSISVRGLQMKTPSLGTGPHEHLPHSPVSRDALDMSVTERADRPFDTSGFADAYKYWKTEFDAERAGVFTISVAQIITALEQSVAKDGVVEYKK